jgi:hypothetical protein
MADIAGFYKVCIAKKVLFFSPPLLRGELQAVRGGVG